MTEDGRRRKVENRAVFCWTRNRKNGWVTASDHSGELGELLTRQFWNDDREVLLKFPALIEGDPKP